MRDYSKISTSLWKSSKFKAIKSDDTARLLYLYLHTSAHVNSVGCFVLPLLYICADIGWSEAQCRNGLETLSRHRLVVWDEGEDVVFLVNFMTFNEFMSPSHAKGSIKVALTLPDCHCKLLLFEDIALQPRVKDNLIVLQEVDRLDTLLRLSRHTEPKPNTETETKTETKTEPEQKFALLTCENGNHVFDDLEKAFSRFKEMAEAISKQTGRKFPTPNVLTETRKKHLSKRLADCGGLDGWEICLRSIAKSKFLSGQEKEFTAAFDWVVNPANFNKIMDGNYERNGNSKSNGQSLADARSAFLANGDD